MPRDDDREQLEDLYVRQGLTVRQLAQRLGVSPRQAWRRLDEAGIPRRPSGVRPTPVDPDTLADLYATQGLTIAEIAERLGVGQAVVQRNLRAHQIRRPPRPRIPADKLERLYLHEGLTAAAIASRTGSSKARVLADLRHWDLPRRSPARRRRRLSRQELEVVREFLDEVLPGPGGPPGHPGRNGTGSAPSSGRRTNPAA